MGPLTRTGVDEPGRTGRVSIVVPTRGPSWVLSSLLSSLSVALPLEADVELIVVLDDAAADLTDTIAGFGYPITVVATGRPSGAAVARNLGFSRTTGALVVFLDDDTIVPPGWLDGLREEFRARPDMGLVGGQLLPDPHAGPVEEAFATLVIHHELRGGRWYLATACLAVEPRAFLALDGFDERFDDASGEDWDLCRRAHGLGIDVTASDRFGVHHRNPTRLRQVLSRSRRYARSARLRFAPDRGVSASAPDARLVRRMQRGGSPVLLALYLAGSAPREIRARYRLVRGGGRSVGRSLLVLLIHLPWLASYTVFSLVHGRTVARQSLRT